MKKFWVKTSAFLLILLMVVGSFASCAQIKATMLNRLDEDERAVKLFDLVNEQMEKVTSYTQEMKLTLTATIASQKLEVEASNQMTTMNSRRDGYLEIGRSEMEMHLDGTRYLSQKTVEGYQDGKMFYGIESKEGDQETKNYLYSELDAKAYQTHKTEKIDSLDVDLDWDFVASSKAKTCREHENGGWIATYSEFDEDGMENLGEIFGEFEALWDDSITLTDVKVTLKTDKKFYPTQMELEPIFESDSKAAKDELPTCTLHIDFSNINDVKDAEKIDLSDYTKVDDLRIVDTVTNALKEFIELDAGRFVMKTKQDAKIGTREESYQEQDVCRFENTEDGFSCNISATIEDDSIAISYRNGLQKTSYKQNGATKIDEAKITDKQAKSQLESLIDPGNLSKNNLAGIVDKGDGVYEFTLAEPDISAFESLIKSQACDVKEKSAVITVTYKDEKLVSYVYELNVSMVGMAGKVNISATATCEYTYIEE